MIAVIVGGAWAVLQGFFEYFWKLAVLEIPPRLWWKRFYPK